LRTFARDVEGDSQRILAELEQWIAKRIVPLKSLYDLVREALEI
jgi:hypothetical protein